MAQIVKRAFKYRFYPTQSQAEEFARVFGCVRLVYNKALDVRTQAWTEEHRRISYAESSAMLTAWKQTPELSFLAEVSSVPLQQTLRHLNAAFVNFFAGRAKYPTFKSKKRSRASAEYTRSAFRFRDGQLRLAKMDEPLNIVWSRPLPKGAEPSTVTVSRDPAGRWHVAILFEQMISPLDPVERSVGVDVGLTALVTLSTGEKVINPRHERRDRRKPAKAQRTLSRKRKGSANHRKAKRRVARVYTRITDRRNDHLHKVTTRLVRENQAIVIEDLAIGNMMKNHRLARAVSDVSWRRLRSMLEYKSAWYGRELIVIDRWFPSTKLCSACGTVRRSLPLDVRSWRCPCGAHHDRDVNAAINILAAGLADSNACGVDVSPQRKNLPARRLTVKQESPPDGTGMVNRPAASSCSPRSAGS